MSPTLILILRFAILAIVAHQLWTMIRKARNRGRLLPVDARGWQRLGGDALTLLIATFALLTLQRNYQQPMDLMASVGPDEIRSVTFRDSRSGSPRSLAEWQGRWVILNIWATWCPPCRREMPALDQVHAEAGTHHTAVIALSDEDPATVDDYLRQHPLNLTVGTVRQLPAALAAIGTRPVSMLISPEGRIVDRVVGARGRDFFRSWAQQHP